MEYLENDESPVLERNEELEYLIDPLFDNFDNNGDLLVLDPGPTNDLEDILELQLAEEAKLDAPIEIEEDIYRPDYELDFLLDDKKHRLAGTISGMAAIISEGKHFVMDGFSGELYVFMDRGPKAGTYIEATESVNHAITSIAKYYDVEEAWGRAVKRREVYDYINIGLRKLEEPDLRHLNVANGLLYISPKGELINYSEEWSPDYLTTVKLPVNYSPEATCPAWEQFVNDVFPADSHHVAWEIIALLMLPLKNKSASAIILKGPQNTGKSTFQNAVLAFLGDSNISNLSIDQFGERFQDTQLKGKLANVVGEMPAIKLNAKTVNSIKKLIGNDPLQGEIKNGKSFMFRSYARCLFSCNDMPTCDTDPAFFDRFNIIPFARRFRKDPIKETWLSETLTSPSELSGVLNKALEALPKVMREGITITQSMKAEIDDIVEDNSDRLATWFEQYVEVEEGARVLFNTLHEHYRKMEPTDWRRTSNKSFGRDLKKLLPDKIVKTQFLLMDGSRPYGFNGLKLKEEVTEMDDSNFLEFDLESLT